MKELPVTIDALLEPLSVEASDEEADRLLSGLIPSELVIKGVRHFHPG